MVASMLGRWARWRRGSLASPLAAALCVYFFYFFFTHTCGACGVCRALACAGIPLALGVPLGLWYVCLSLPAPAPAVPLPPVTPADLLRISDCIPQIPKGPKSKNIENKILLQP